MSNVQTSTPSEFVQGFRDYAEQGYDLVFGHGFEFQDPAHADRRRVSPAPRSW